MRSPRSIAVALSVSLVVTACQDVTDPPFFRTGPAASFDVDPNPDSAGYFIAGVTPNTCFQDLNAGIADGDWDWLDQSCEYALAKAFNPLYRFSLTENCYEREPVWAAKYFNSSPSVVRIAYMPAYWRDCGTDGHDGDSEMVMVEVIFNSATQHWELRQLWTSAHFGTGTYDRSKWHAASQVEYPNKNRGYPRVYVAGDKHGNFTTRDGCNNGWFGFDECHPYELFSARDSIFPDRNAGSRHVPFLGCILSTDAVRVMSGRCETFYGSQRFNGWAAAAPGTGGSSSYRMTLMNAQFERRDEPGYPDWGPGPYPPGYVPYTTYMSGPSYVKPGQLCQWFLHSGLSGSVEWIVDGEVISTDWSVWYSFTETKVLSVFIRNGSDHEDDARNIIVSPDAPDCSTEW